MKISVVVPVHNVPRNLLTPCLDSLAMQTLRKHEYEIIIVDDCSTERETIEGIDEFAEHALNAQVVRHTENLGLNEARWSGVKNASGEYVVFIDGDDPIVRDGLENLRMEAARVDADMVTAPMIRWHPLTKSYNNIPTTDDGLPEDYVNRLQVILSGKSTFSMCGRLFRRNLLSDDVFALPIGQIHEDVTTFPRIAFKAKIVTHCVKPLYLYTLNFSSLTTQFTAKHPDGIIYGLRDWIENARSRGLLDLLSEAISTGAEKLVNVCVLERCFFSSNLSDLEKARVLKEFREEYLALNLRPIELSAPAVRFLNNAAPEMFEGDPAQLSRELAEIFPYAAPSQLKSDQILPYGLGPSEMAQRLKDKVVFIGQVDYQVRNAAAFARELTLRGHNCVVLDNSGFVAGGKRPFPADELHIFYESEHVRVESGPYPVDWLSTAKLVIVFNDFNEDFRDALEFRNRLELPSACAIEGINDFLRVDFEGYHTLPYRRCGHVFLAGEHDRKFFADRKTYVTGLPIVEKFRKKEVCFPPEPMAVLNVNFTYGALEHQRNDFVQKAKGAFEAAGLNWKITQHPMDKGQFDDLPVSSRTQYQLIDDCTVFVSRFATGILEALASGKPAIYFNPHRERVDKFNQPLGAFEIATTEEELTQALRTVLSEVEEGVDFRARAQDFLSLHTGYNPAGPTIGAQFAAAVIDVIDSYQDAQNEASELFFRLAKHHGLYNANENYDEVVLGAFDRRNKAQLNEDELIGRYFGDRGKLMIDLEANLGDNFEIFLGKGWEVHAFTSDPSDRQAMLEKWPDCEQLTVNNQPISIEADQNVAICDSGESANSSRLFKHSGERKRVGEVQETTLSEYYSSKGIKHADFFRIDIDAGGLLALKGFPWDFDKPGVVLAEFADIRTTPLGYTTHDLANLLIEQGYSVFISEWLPILDQGATKNWRRMLRYSPDLELSDSWGKIIGFSEQPSEDTMARLTKQTLKFDAKADSLGVKGSSGPKRLSGEAIDKLLLELDRLWVLSLLQGHTTRPSLFSSKRTFSLVSSKSLQDLAKLAKKQNILVTTPESFDEEAYLKTYPDVAAEVGPEGFSSGYEHYALFGHLEARQRPVAS